MAKQKPSLTLVSGKRALDVDKLAAAFTKLTGRKPTEKELERARAKATRNRAS